MTQGSRGFGREALSYAAGSARLPLPPERAELVGTTLQRIYALIDTLDAVPLGETPPATAFDARRGGE